jgi:hypothetical protein
MLMNYHELTMAEPRDSPARRKQFLIICTVMASAFFYSFISSGGLSPVEISVGEFPGGDYIFKHSKRDYAAGQGMVRSIGKELGLKPKELADVMYAVYLDHPGVVTGGRSQRFAAGLLAKKGDKRKEELLAKNTNVKPVTELEGNDLAASDLWQRLKYESMSLPKAKSAVVQFPFTNGFVSAIIFSWKVLPALHNYVEANSDGPAIVVSTCSIKDQMCTHYSPLSKVTPFLLRQEESKAYASKLAPEKLIDFDVILATLKKVFRPIINLFSSSSDSDEL